MRPKNLIVDPFILTTFSQRKILKRIFIMAAKLILCLTVLLKGIIAQFLLTVRLVLEKLILCKALKSYKMVQKHN